MKFFLFISALFLFGAPLMADDYKAPHIKNLARAYWALDAMDIDNNEHVDNYLLINECQIFTDFFSDDFAWREIREAGRQSIIQQKESFPVKFSFSKEIRLDNYDFEAGKFPLFEDDQIISTRKFLFQALSTNDEICAQDFSNVAHYPAIIVVEISAPVTIKDVKVEENLAKTYVEYADGILREDENFDRQLLDLGDFRKAYMFFDIEFEAYKGVIPTANQGGLGNILARLDGIRVYADQSAELLLYAQKSDELNITRTTLEEQYKALRGDDI